MLAAFEQIAGEPSSSTIQPLGTWPRRPWTLSGSFCRITFGSGRLRASPSDLLGTWLYVYVEVRERLGERVSNDGTHSV